MARCPLGGGSATSLRCRSQDGGAVIGCRLEIERKSFGFFSFCLEIFLNFVYYLTLEYYEKIVTFVSYFRGSGGVCAGFGTLQADY